MNQSILKKIPSVNAILESSIINDLSKKYSHELVVNSVRRVLDQVRNKLIPTEKSDPHQSALHEVDLTLSVLHDLVIQDVETCFVSTLQPSINATGIILHTNLGRSPLSVQALEHMVNVSKGYSSLEIDVKSGKRTSRYNHIQSIITFLTGAEDALVVNNNAAAVLLVLDTLARGKEVIVSRSELVEIGGSFRMPDVMEKGGSILVEVGTTNKTYISDYRKAISDRTGLILVVHPSNFRIVGFTETPELKEIADLGKEFGIPTFYDLGSGAMIDFSGKGANSEKLLSCNFNEPTVKDSISAGIDITSFSTDKLLGGPQGGLVVGKKELVDKCKSNPLLRALRVDKTTLSALDATLRLYLDDDRAIESIPILKMIYTPLKEIACRVEKIEKDIMQNTNGFYCVVIEDGKSQIGGGSMPAEELPTKVLVISSKHISSNKLAAGLRANSSPIFARIERDRVLFDLRTVIDEWEEKEIIDALKRIADLDPRGDLMEAGYE